MNFKISGSPRITIFILALLPNIIAISLVAAFEIVERKEWGGHPVRTDGVIQQQYSTQRAVKYISVHYTQSRPTHPRWKENELLRFVQEGHLKARFGDIAYHYLVGHSGAIYKGRKDTVSPATFTHYYNSRLLRRARYGRKGELMQSSVGRRSPPGSTDGHLTVTFIAGVGNPQLLPQRSMANGAKLIARLLIKHGLNPSAVRAHREIAITKCPGDVIYEWLRGGSMQLSGVGVGMRQIRREYKRLKQ